MSVRSFVQLLPLFFLFSFSKLANFLSVFPFSHFVSVKMIGKVESKCVQNFCTLSPFTVKFCNTSSLSYAGRKRNIIHFSSLFPRCCVYQSVRKGTGQEWAFSIPLCTTSTATKRRTRWSDGNVSSSFFVSNLSAIVQSQRLIRMRFFSSPAAASAVATAAISVLDCWHFADLVTSSTPPRSETSLSCFSSDARHNLESHETQLKPPPLVFLPICIVEQSPCHWVRSSYSSCFRQYVRTVSVSNFKCIPDRELSFSFFEELSRVIGGRLLLLSSFAARHNMRMFWNWTLFAY